MIVITTVMIMRGWNKCLAPAARMVSETEIENTCSTCYIKIHWTPLHVFSFQSVILFHERHFVFFWGKGDERVRSSDSHEQSDGCVFLVSCTVVVEDCELFRFLHCLLQGP